jgi:uncharacterized repeat protein (TIGR01451 family)
VIKSQRFQTGTEAPGDNLITHPYTTDLLTNGVVGKTVQYQLAVTNTGNTTLTNVTPSDTGCHSGTLSPTSVFALPASASTSFFCSHVITSADRSSGFFENGNTGNPCSVSATPPSGSLPADSCGPVVVIVRCTCPHIFLGYCGQLLHAR